MPRSLIRAVGPETEMAATTAPSTARTGAATAASPTSSSSSDDGPAAAAHLDQGVVQVRAVDGGVRGAAFQIAASAVPALRWASSTLPSAVQCGGTSTPTQLVAPTT